MDAAPVYTPVFYFYSTDYLGSSNILTDQSGNLVQQYEYTTFGQTAYQSNTSAFPISNRYTGQIADDETGLYYYGGRYYDPQLGRFIQPDPEVADPTDSQSYNHYSYCRNNPLNATDPSGFFDYRTTASWTGGYNFTPIPLPPEDSIFQNIGGGFNQFGNDIINDLGNAWDNIQNNWGDLENSFSGDGPSSSSFWQNVQNNWMHDIGGFEVGANNAAMGALQEFARNMVNPFSSTLGFVQTAHTFIANPASIGNAYHNALRSLQTPQGIGGFTFNSELGLGTGGIAAPEMTAGTLTEGSAGALMDSGRGGFVDLMLAQKHAGLINSLVQGGCPYDHRPNVCEPDG